MLDEAAAKGGRDAPCEKEGGTRPVPRSTASEACERKRQRPEGGRRTVVKGRERGMRERAAVFSFCGKMKSILAFKNKETSKS